jgi:ribonuclease III
VLGLITSEYLYRRRPDEHEGQLTKTKSLLVSKAILSRRALRMGLGRFVLMSHSEVESGGRQRLSILADAFESVLGAIYLDQGFETARQFIHTQLLTDTDEIVADKRHTNYKSHLQEYVQSTFRTHPVYRIRSEYGPDHSKHFMVEVMVGRRTLGEGRGHNKKEAEQAAARAALENVKRVPDGQEREADAVTTAPRREASEREDAGESRRRSRRGGRGRYEKEAPARESRPSPKEELELASNSMVEEYEAEEDSIADEADFDLEVIEPVAGNSGNTRPDDDDEEEVADDLLDDDDDEVDDIDDEDDEDDDDDVDDDDDDEEEDDDEVPVSEGRGVRRLAEPERRPEARATYEPAPAPAPPAASPPAPPRPAAVVYGRSTRRSGRRAAPVAGAPQPEPGVASEALHVDPFGLGEPERPAAQVEPERIVEPPAPEPPPSKIDDEERVAEIERAMSNFGQRKPDAYGRRGRPARRGR